MPAARARENTPDHATKRGDRGRWLPGSSPNPGGRPKIIEDIRALAREHSPAAIQTLRHIAEHGKQESARVAASVALLDRAWGKPTQPIAGDDELPGIGINGTAVAALSAEDRVTLVSAIAESLRAAQ
jgi:hypothetical protein